MSNAAVKAKTGKDWDGWFGLLDAAGAKVDGAVLGVKEPTLLVVVVERVRQFA